MTESAWIKIGYIVAWVTVYALVCWCLMWATHEFRVQAGCEADRWARDSRVEPAIRTSLAGLADMVYRLGAPWLVLLILAVAVLLPRRTIERFHSNLTISDDPDVAATVVRLKLRLLLASITASPLACVFAILVVALDLSMRSPALSVGSSMDALKERVSMAGDRLVPRRLSATA